MTDEEIARIRRDRWAATQPAGTAARVRDFRETLDLVRPQP